MSSRDKILSQRYESDESERPVKEIRDNVQLWITDAEKDRIDDEFSRLRYELDRDRDFHLEKLRHYHPVLLECGLQAVEEMDAGAFMDALNELDVR